MTMWLLMLFLWIHPESALVLQDRVFVSDIGAFGKPDGQILEWQGEDQEPHPLARGLRDPKGMAPLGQGLVVADVDRLMWVSLQTGQVRPFALPRAFPHPPRFLNDVTSSPEGTVYVSDTRANRVYRLNARGEVERWVEVPSPNGLWLEGDTLYVVSFTSPARLYRIVNMGRPQLLHEFRFAMGGDGLARLTSGDFVVSGYLSGTLVLWAPSREERVIAEDLTSPADLAVDTLHHRLIVPLLEAGQVITRPLPR